MNKRAFICAMKAVSALLCCVMMLLFTGCGARTLEMNTSSTTTNKVTHTGVIEYHGEYYIADKFGINYKSGIDSENMIVRVHSSEENGSVKDNFAIDEKYIYFISEYEDSSKILYRGSTDGKKRTKIYVRDTIDIVACYNNKVYFTDERNMLIFIDAETKEKTEVTQAVGTGFVQCSNSIFFTAGNGSLKVYNCDDDAVLEVDTGNAVGYNTTSKGLVYAVNSSESEDSYSYKFSTFTYHEAKVEAKAAVDTKSKYTAFTETLAFASEKNSLKTCNISNGTESEYSYKKQGNLIYNAGLDYNVYYLNDNVCLKFSPESEKPQVLNVDFKKNKIDYTQVVAVVNDEKVITIEDDFYEIKSIV